MNNKDKIKKAIDKMETESKISQFKKKKLKDLFRTKINNKDELSRNEIEKLKDAQYKLDTRDKFIRKYGTLLSFSIMAFIYTLSLSSKQQMSLMENFIIIICVIGVVAANYNRY